MKKFFKRSSSLFFAAILSSFSKNSMPRADGREGPDTSSWEIKDFLTFRMNLLYRLLDRQLKKMLAEHHDLSIAEWRVFGQLATATVLIVRNNLYALRQL